MWSRLRSVLLKTPVKIALGLISAYFLFALLAFEPLLKWAGAKFIADKSRHSLTIEAAKFDPLDLSIDIKGLRLTEPDGKPLFAFAQLLVDFDAASLFKRAWAFERIRLVAPEATVELRADGSLNWSALIEALKSEDEEEDTPLPRLYLRDIALERGKVAFADRKVGFATTLDPLDLQLVLLSTLPDDKDDYSVAAITQGGARIRLKGKLMLNPMAVNGDVAVDQLALARYWPYLQSGLNLAPPAGTAAASLKYAVAYADKQLSLKLNDIAAHLDGLALRGQGADHDAVRLDRVALAGGSLDLGQRRVSLGSFTVQGGKVDVRRNADGRLDVQDWFKTPPSPAGRGAGDEGTVAGSKHSLDSAAKTASGGGGQAWQVSLAQFGLDGLALHFADAGFARPLAADAGNLKVGFKAAVAAGSAATQVELDDIGFSLADLRLTGGGKPLFKLGGIELAGGKVDLAAQSARFAKLALSHGRLDIVRDARGEIDLLQALVLARPRPAATVQKASAEAKSGWHYALEQLRLDDFRIGLKDETVQPAGGLTLQGIEATVSGISDDLNQPLPVKLAFGVKEGGGFQAQGKVIPAKARGDLNLNLAGLALAPVQPWLAQTTHLTLASGRVSTQGRVSFDGKARGDKLAAFKGGFSVDDLLLNETSGGERFLAWQRLGSDSVSASPAALAIEELKLDGLDTKLIIAADKSVNLKKILRQPATPTGGEAVDSSPVPDKPTTPQPKAAGESGVGSLSPSPSHGGGGEPFRVDIDRIRVSGGKLDFSDHSLKLPFGTRIHDLKGAVNGISSRPGGVAEMELDGQVDEFGLARAVGQVNLFAPTDFMDIKTVFRNVEMANLTPYTATFAGYKIKSGKLSLDLEYKIKQRQLAGENQVIIDRLTLGERLEGPDIKHLPLELAIAILEDSDGRIDLGLPVSGSLDDPEFSYGRIVWKAIGNVLSKIVTAPFRALASLFGGNSEKLEQVLFEAGAPGLTPPEKEKFKQIARVLEKRPRLALTVHGAWSAEIDRPVMKERQLRRAVVEKMGVKLAADEDPGPISTSNPKAQAALEGLYAQREGDADWKALQTNWLKANPDKKRESGAGKMWSRLKGVFKSEEPLAEADRAALHGRDLHALLFERLLAKETVDDAVLQQLAQRRTQAIVTGLVAAGGPAARIHTGGSSAFQGEGREVPAKLELGVAK